MLRLHLWGKWLRHELNPFTCIDLGIFQFSPGTVHTCRNLCAYTGALGHSWHHSTWNLRTDCQAAKQGHSAVGKNLLEKPPVNSLLQWTPLFQSLNKVEGPSWVPWRCQNLRHTLFFEIHIQNKTVFFIYVRLGEIRAWALVSSLHFCQVFVMGWLNLYNLSFSCDVQPSLLCQFVCAFFMEFYYPCLFPLCLAKHLEVEWTLIWGTNWKNWKIGMWCLRSSDQIAFRRRVWLGSAVF